MADLEGRVSEVWLPKDAYEPGGKAAAELKGAVPAAEEILDLALAAAFTSMSLRDRCRDPAVDADLVLTVEAAGGGWGTLCPLVGLGCSFPVCWLLS